jgi:uncharacterized protein YdeI (BOF family)
MSSVVSVIRFSFGLVLCLGLGSSLLGCGSTPEAQSSNGNLFSVLDMGGATKVRDAQKQKPNTSVRLQGKITTLAPLAGGLRAYELRDETGSIWVVTQQRVPPVGASIAVQGTIRLEKIVIDGRDQSSVYLEQG